MDHGRVRLNSTLNYMSSPPIFKLNHDIVLYIFFLNADMDQESEEEIPAMFTLRDTSQVCAGWRALAVGATSLWARVLNFSFMSERRKVWREEVVRRTGAAALHIRGRDNFSDLWCVEPFHSWVVGENWNRIRSLDIKFSMDMQIPLGEAQRWAGILRRPAPSLEEFTFSWSAGRDELSARDFILFSNQAPGLRTLSVAGIKLNPGALPMPHICHLVLHSPVLAPGLLGALSHMPLLETLQIRNPGSIALDQNMHKSRLRITFPKLIDISFLDTDWTDDSLPFLSHISPANCCVLSFPHADEWSNKFSPGILCNVLSTYPGPETAAMQLESLLFTDNLPFFVCIPSCQQFFFSMDRFIAEFPGHDINTLFESVKNLRLDKITDLRLRLRDAKGLLSNANGVKFVRALVSVKALDTDCETLHALSVIQSTMKVVILPALQVIWLDGIDEQVHVSFISGFLNSRTKLGKRAHRVAVKAAAKWVQYDLLKEVRALGVEIVPYVY